MAGWVASTLPAPCPWGAGVAQPLPTSVCLIREWGEGAAARLRAMAPAGTSLA